MSSTARLRAAFTSSWAQPSHLAKVSAASTVEVLIGSTPRCGCCPASSSNGVQWVAEWTLLLYTNSASGSLSPVVLLMAHEDPEVCFYLLVDALHLAISLWVVGGRRS